METAADLAIFNSSEKTRAVRQIKYLGGGESMAFDSVNANKPYGNINIEKLECIGHIQKHLGTHF